MQTSQGTIKPITYLGFVNDDRLLLVKYKQAPNPSRASSWWIPAPELSFGEDPKELAKQTAAEWGLHIKNLALADIESFTTPGGWHLLYHFKVQTESRAVESSNIAETRWVTKEELQEMKDIAHGAWEIELGLSLLEA